MSILSVEEMLKRARQEAEARARAGLTSPAVGQDPVARIQAQITAFAKAHDMAQEMARRTATPAVKQETGIAGYLKGLFRPQVGNLPEVYQPRVIGAEEYLPVTPPELLEPGLPVLDRTLVEARRLSQEPTEDEKRIMLAQSGKYTPGLPIEEQKALGPMGPVASEFAKELVAPYPVPTESTTVPKSTAEKIGGAAAAMAGRALNPVWRTLASIPGIKFGVRMGAQAVAGQAQKALGGEKVTAKQAALDIGVSTAFGLASDYLAPVVQRSLANTLAKHFPETLPKAIEKSIPYLAPFAAGATVGAARGTVSQVARAIQGEPIELGPALGEVALESLVMGAINGVLAGVGLAPKGKGADFYRTAKEIIEKGGTEQWTVLPGAPSFAFQYDPKTASVRYVFGVFFKDGKAQITHNFLRHMEMFEGGQVPSAVVGVKVPAVGPVMGDSLITTTQIAPQGTAPIPPAGGVSAPVAALVPKGLEPAEVKVPTTGRRAAFQATDLFVGQPRQGEPAPRTVAEAVGPPGAPVTAPNAQVWNNTTKEYVTVNFRTEGEKRLYDFGDEVVQGLTEYDTRAITEGLKRDLNLPDTHIFRLAEDYARQIKAAARLASARGTIQAPPIPDAAKYRTKPVSAPAVTPTPSKAEIVRPGVPTRFHEGDVVEVEVNGKWQRAEVKEVNAKPYPDSGVRYDYRTQVGDTQVFVYERNVRPVAAPGAPTAAGRFPGAGRVAVAEPVSVGGFNVGDTVHLPRDATAYTVSGFMGETAILKDPQGKTKNAALNVLEPVAAKLYEGLTPGTAEWMRVWREHPELQDEMAAYGKTVTPEAPAPTPAAPLREITPIAKLPLVAIGQTVYRSDTGEALTVTNISDRALLGVKNARGTEFKMGRGAVTLEAPAPPPPPGAPEVPAPAPEAAPSAREQYVAKVKAAQRAANRPVVVENKALGEVELRFKRKPDEEVLAQLREAAFEWSKKRNVWFAKANEENLAKAGAIAAGETVPAARAVEPGEAAGQRVPMLEKKGPAFNWNEALRKARTYTWLNLQMQRDALQGKRYDQGTPEQKAEVRRLTDLNKKSALDEWLMQKYGIDEAQAHTLANQAEQMGEPMGRIDPVAHPDLSEHFAKGAIPGTEPALAQPPTEVKPGIKAAQKAPAEGPHALTDWNTLKAMKVSEVLAQFEGKFEQRDTVEIKEPESLSSQQNDMLTRFKQVNKEYDAQMKRRRSRERDATLGNLTREQQKLDEKIRELNQEIAEDVYEQLAQSPSLSDVQRKAYRDMTEGAKWSEVRKPVLDEMTSIAVSKGLPPKIAETIANRALDNFGLGDLQPSVRAVGTYQVMDSESMIAAWVTADKGIVLSDVVWQALHDVAGEEMVREVSGLFHELMDFAEGAAERTVLERVAESGALAYSSRVGDLEHAGKTLREVMYDFGKKDRSYWQGRDPEKLADTLRRQTEGLEKVFALRKELFGEEPAYDLDGYRKALSEFEESLKANRADVEKAASEIVLKPYEAPERKSLSPITSGAIPLREARGKMFKGTWQGRQFVTDGFIMVPVTDKEIGRYEATSGKPLVDNTKGFEQVMRTTDAPAVGEPVGMDAGEDGGVNVLVYFKTAKGDLMLQKKYYDYVRNNGWEMRWPGSKKEIDPRGEPLETAQPVYAFDEKGELQCLVMPVSLPKTKEVILPGKPHIEPPEIKPVPDITKFESRPPSSTVQALRDAEKADAAGTETIPGRDEKPDGLEEIEDSLAKELDDAIGRPTDLGIVPPAVAESMPQGDNRGFKFNERLEKQWQASNGVRREGTWAKFLTAVEDFKRKASREFENLPRTAENAEIRYRLLELLKQKDVQSHKTLTVLRAIVDRVKQTDLWNLFERAVVFADLQHEYDAERPLPYEMTREEFTEEKVRLDEEVAKHPEIAEALTKRKGLWKALVRAYIDAMEAIGFHVADRFLDENGDYREDYFHHQVLEHVNDIGVYLTTGRKLQTPTRRGWLQKREGYPGNINRNYVESEFEVMAQMMFDVKKAELIALVQSPKYNVIQESRQKAATLNDQAMERIIEQEKREYLAKNKRRKKAVSQTEKTLNLMKGRIGWGFGQLGALAESGKLWDGQRHEFRDVVKSLKTLAEVDAEFDQDVRNKTFRYLAALKAQDVEGSMPAATILKNVSERREFVREKLDTKYKTWENCIPEGYVAWQPREGNVFYMANTIPEHLAEEIAEGLLQAANIPPADVKRIMAVGGKRPSYVIREEIAATLDNLMKPRSNDPLVKGIRDIVRAWKANLIIGPTRFTKSNARNTSGDADALFVGNASAFKKALGVVEDLYRVYYKDAPIPVKIKAWFEMGGMESTMQVQDLGDVSQLRVFSGLIERKGGLTAVPAKVWRWYWDNAHLTFGFRESILRLACYLDYVEQMEANKEGRPRNFGASIPAEIMALPTIEQRAFVLSNQLLGAYDQVSVVGQWLATYMAPFWRYREVNFKRYMQLFRNALTDGKGAEVAGRTFLNVLKRSPMTAARLLGFLLKAAAFWALLQAFNKGFYPDEEDELSEDIRSRPHIVLGRNADGSIRYFSRLGAVGDILDWFGLDAPQRMVSDWLNGRKSLGETLKEMAQGPLNTLWQQLAWVKMLADFVGGIKTYPDLFKPGRMRDKWQYLFDQLGVGEQYRWVRGLPHRPYSEWLKELLVYTDDPGQGSYYDILDAKREFEKKLGKYTEFGGSTSPRSNALYNLKLAGRYQDADAMEKYLTEYIMLGGTEKGLETSLRNMHPLYGLNKEERDVFIEHWLDDEGRERLGTALRFYEQVLLAKREEGKR